jgi:hypothetical protein
MKLVMTLVVRDEADVLDAQLAYHLNVGVDFVIATDHRSVDSTSEILESYARDGYLRLFREEAEEIRQSAWVTRMARLAATDHAADWVINSDADEFWWPRARSLKEALAGVPASLGVVYAPICNFVPRRRDGHFYDSMTMRLVQPAPINNPLGRYRPTLKAAHRATPTAVVFRGNHEVKEAGQPLWSYYPLEVLHFPDRSPEQAARKYANTVEAWPVAGRAPGAFVLAARDAIERVGVWESFDHLAVEDADLVGTRAGFEVDTRVRDALRRLHSSTDDSFARPHELKEPFELALPSTLDATRHALDAGVIREAELIRIHRKVDDLGVRVRALEKPRNGFAVRRLARRRHFQRR